MTIEQTLSRLGGWLPLDPIIHATWLKELIEEATKAAKPLHPVMVEFKEMIEGDPELFMYFTTMFKQASKRDPKEATPGDIRVKDYEQMILLINHVLDTAPKFLPPRPGEKELPGLIGFPINGILDRVMATPSGYSAFLLPRVNEMLKTILNRWCVFLSSRDSLYVLETDPESENYKNSWLSEEAQKWLKLEEFNCNKTLPHWGFTSWNDFFIRSFKPGERSITEEIANNPKAIVSACESEVYHIKDKVQLCDRFWLKEQPYSLRHMMEKNPLAAKFVNGTVYQAFLSATKYHRWHSPVDGTVVDAYVVDGSYYAEDRAEGFDPYGPNNSQGFIAHVAARAVIFIETKELGLVCFISIGMAEVSSNIITANVGQKLKKGDELGYFQFGGSSHCLIFQEGVVDLKEYEEKLKNKESINLKVNEPLTIGK